MNKQDILESMRNDARDHAARQFSRWDDRFFRRLWYDKFYYVLDDLYHEDHPQLCRDYLTLVSEMIGRGYIHDDDSIYDISRQNFLAHAFLNLVAWRFRDLSHSQRQDTLVTLWNLGEGILQSPQWIQEIIRSKCHEFYQLDTIEHQLESLLAPAMSQVEPATWEGPFAVSVLDMREVDETFLPGNMYMVSPTVLCVQERRREGEYIGVFLNKNGQSSFIGSTGDLGSPYPSTQPTLHFGDNHVEIDEQHVPLTHFGTCQHHTCSEAGFLVANTRNSQRLWIVESP